MALGTDTHPGGEGPGSIKWWWTKGPGLQRWVSSPTPWRTLYSQLKEHMSDDMAKRCASEWFHEVFGIWSGERKGQNPLGPG
jgi:hypothetical protein